MNINYSLQIYLCKHLLHIIGQTCSYLIMPLQNIHLSLPILRLELCDVTKFA